jgi:hypothetical protein
MRPPEITLAGSSTASALGARNVSAPGFARSITAPMPPVPAGPTGTMLALRPEAG